jgi:hypothetical protein
VLIVTRLDRLARSTRDLLNVLAIVAERGAGFRSLKDAWADTTTSNAQEVIAKRKSSLLSINLHAIVVAVPPWRRRANVWRNKTRTEREATKKRDKDHTKLTKPFEATDAGSTAMKRGTVHRPYYGPASGLVP